MTARPTTAAIIEAAYGLRVGRQVRPDWTPRKNTK